MRGVAGDRDRLLVPLSALLIGLSVLLSVGFAFGASHRVTVSGTVTDDAGTPLAGIAVEVIGQGIQTTTSSQGEYSVEVWPGVVTLWFGAPGRLEAQYKVMAKQIRLEDVTADLRHDVVLPRGYFISGRVIKPRGDVGGSERHMNFVPIYLDGYEGEHLGASIPPGRDTFSRILAPGVYWVELDRPPLPQHGEGIAVDLRDGDVANVELVITGEQRNPIPDFFPDARKIHIGEPDADGMVTVTGEPGTVVPLGHVVVVNLSTFRASFTASYADGSFETEVYAPPGSVIDVKHGTHSWQWEGWEKGGLPAEIAVYPGTTLLVPTDSEPTSDGMPFSINRNISALLDDDASTRDYVTGVWQLEGTLRAVTQSVDDEPRGIALSLQNVERRPRLEVGDRLEVSATMTVRSPAIEQLANADDVEITGYVLMVRMFDEDGNPIPYQHNYLSNVMTSTGLPIQAGRGPAREFAHNLRVEDLRRTGDETIEGTLSFDAQIGAYLPPGIYRPELRLRFRGLPWDDTWVAVKIGKAGEYPHGLLPPIEIGDVASPKLPWMLLMQDIVEGVRGTQAQEDDGTLEVSSNIVTQGARYIVPPNDARSGDPIPYRLEPVLPVLSFANRSMPHEPTILLDLPGGELNVSIARPDGSTEELGAAPFVQGIDWDPVSAAGLIYNPGTQCLQNPYALTTLDDRFVVTLDQYGHYIVSMTGTVDDIWGSEYAGGGTYDVWVAELLDVEGGMLPGTPFEVGDAFNTSVQFHPAVPADVEWTITLHPDSDPERAIVHTVSGRANDFGCFSPEGNDPILSKPGEYRVEFLATYEDPTGRLFMASRVWGGVVETPNAIIEAHGLRGTDVLAYIPPAWFVLERDLEYAEGDVHHIFNPYFSGDIIWSTSSDKGDSLVFGQSIRDTVGLLEPLLRDRAERWEVPISGPLIPLDEWFETGEIPLFTGSDEHRAHLIEEDDLDQLAYAYCSSQRPGERVREAVIGSAQRGGYWRLDTIYDNQMGMGLLGDRPNDFKFQYIGAVYRDLTTGINQYAIHGSLWVFIPDSDLFGSRVMPPFSGEGNGGWTTEGGAILTLKGEDIDIFIHPTGTQPGAVLNVGDAFTFAGHIAPTLASDIAITVTSPSGEPHPFAGQGNKIGVLGDIAEGLILDEPGIWTVDVKVWHDGLCSGGHTVPPYPSGNVLGSEDGRFVVYVVEPDAPRLDVRGPIPGFLPIGAADASAWPSTRTIRWSDFRMTIDTSEIPPVEIRGRAPEDVASGWVDYTIRMPGTILDHGRAPLEGGWYSVIYDPVALSNDFPNLDLAGNDRMGAGLADTVSISLLFEGETESGTIRRANTVSIQGERVFVGLPGTFVWRPDLAIDAQDPAELAVGETFERRIELHHPATSDGSAIGGITVTDPAADAIALIEKTGGDDDDRLETNERWTYVLTYEVPATGPTLETEVSVRGDALDGAPIEVRLAATFAVTRPAVLDLGVSAPSEVVIGEASTFTFTLRHDAVSSGEPIADVDVQAPRLGSVALVAKESGNDDDLLEFGEAWTYEASFTPIPGGATEVVGSAVARGADPDGNPIEAHVDFAMGVVSPPAPAFDPQAALLQEEYDDANVDADLLPAPEHFSGQFRVGEYDDESAFIATCNCFFDVEDPWTDYAFATRFAALNARLTISYRTSGDARYYVEFHPRTGRVYLGKARPRGWDHRLRVASAPFPFEHGAWYEVVIAGIDSEIRVFIDGQLLLLYDDPDPILAGGVGFETVDDAPHLIVDYLRVWSLATEAASAPESSEALVSPSLDLLDEFDGPLSSEWTWLRGRDDVWSLTERPGTLRITVQPGAGKPPHGAVVVAAPAGDFTIETKVEFTPLDNFQRAGLLIYGDVDNVLVLSRAFCSYTGAGCVLNGIYFDSTLEPANHATETSEKDVAWLRLWKRGQEVFAQYSGDGSTWQAIGTHSFPYAGVLRVGIIADGERGDATGVPAYFDYFLLEERK